MMPIFWSRKRDGTGRLTITWLLSTLIVSSHGCGAAMRVNQGGGEQHSSLVPPSGSNTAHHVGQQEGHSIEEEEPPAVSEFSLANQQHKVPPLVDAAGWFENDAITHQHRNLMEAFTCEGCVATGRDHICAVRSDRKMACWGNDRYDQTSIPFEWDSNITRVATGEWHSCAVNGNTQLRCWGRNDDDDDNGIDVYNGIMVYNDRTDVPAEFQNNVVDVGGGYAHTCAVTNAGEVGCWGNNDRNQTVVPDGLTGVKLLSVGSAHNCVVTNTTELRCWGENHYFQTNIPPGWNTSIESVSAGWAHTCAVNAKRMLECWGYNSFTGETSIPSGWDTNIVSVSAGWSDTCAVNSTGAVECWGDWTAVPSHTGGVVAVANGAHVRCIITEDSSLSCIANTNRTSANPTPPSGFMQLSGEITSPLPTSPLPLPPPDGSLSGGAIAGIVIGCIAAFAIVVASVAFFVMRRKKKKQPHQSAADTAMANFLKDSTKSSISAVLTADRSTGGLHAGRGDAPPLESMYLSEWIASLATSAPESAGASLETSGARSYVIDADALVFEKDSGGRLLQLGHGAFSKVYRAKLQDKDVAVKVMEHSAQQEGHIKQMLREIAMLRQCNHESIVEFFGACFAGSNVMMVFELMPQGDLFHALGSHAAAEYMWKNRGYQLAVSIAKGMAYMHGHDPCIIHCDLKSPNILLSSSGQAKIGDMGMSKHLTKEYVTKGAEVGSFAWAAPELLLDSRITEKVDIFSFGVILWELVTGELPQRGHHRKPRVPEECSQEACDLIGACCRTEGAHRPTAAELVTALESLPEANEPAKDVLTNHYTVIAISRQPST